MFVFVDALTDPVLLTIDPPLLRLRQMPVVLGHILLLALLHGGLALFQVRGLLRTQLTALHTIGNAIFAGSAPVY